MYLTYTGFSNFNCFILKFENDPEQIHEKKPFRKIMVLEGHTVKVGLFQDIPK